MEELLLNSDQAARVSGSRVVLGIVLAIVFGLALPFVLVLQMTMLPLLMIPVLLLGGILMAWLHGWCGWVPAAAFMTASVISLLMVHPTLMWMCVAGMILPGIAVIGGMTRKRPFFEQLRLALIVWMAGLVGAIFIAYRAFGADMIARLMATVQAQYDALPDAALMPLVDYFNQAAAMGGLGQLGGGAGASLTSGMTVSDLRALMTAAITYMRQMYSENAPGTLLSGAVWSAVLSVLWGNWRMARRGVATRESFVGMSAWYLPAHVTAGALALIVVSYIMTGTGGGSGLTMWNACSMLSGAAFTIQALSSLDRRMVQRGTRTGSREIRVGLILALSWLIPLLRMVTQLYGAASALFGSRGALTKLVNRIKENSDKDDSDQ